MTEIKSNPKPEGQDKVNVRIQFQPEDFSQFNVTVWSNEEETRMFNLSINEQVARSILVPHPVFHMQSRLSGVLKGWDNYRRKLIILKIG